MFNVLTNDLGPESVTCEERWVQVEQLYPFPLIALPAQYSQMWWLTRLRDDEMITMMPDGDLDDLDAVADNEEDKDSTPEDDA